MGEIRAAVARKRKNQAWLARELGVSDVWVSTRIGTGTVRLDLRDIERIAQVLDVSVSSLFGEKASA